MELSFIEIVDEIRKYEICRDILADLPLWFGIPESTLEYCLNVKKHRMVGIQYSGKIIGFISIKENNSLVEELYVLGILQEYHRLGIGSKALDYIYNEMRKRGIQYLEVKTFMMSPGFRTGIGG